MKDDTDLYEAQRGVFLDPRDPAVAREAERQGIPLDWIDAAKKSPVLRLINDYKVALPLHPEYRTMPMVWYIPPLSPIVDAVRETGHDAEDAGNLFGAIDALRIPLEYLANLFTAGDVEPVAEVLDKLAAMRSYMRDINLEREPREEIAQAVGMTGSEVKEMFRLLAIAKYDERYVIPTAHAEQAHALEELATDCPVGEGGPGAFGGGSGGPVPVAIQTLRETKERMQADDMSQVPGSVSYLQWDGRGMPGKASAPRRSSTATASPAPAPTSPPTRAPRPRCGHARAGGPAVSRRPAEWLGRLVGGGRPQAAASEMPVRRRHPAPTLPEPELRTGLAVGLAAAQLPRRAGAGPAAGHP